MRVGGGVREDAAVHSVPCTIAVADGARRAAVRSYFAPGVSVKEGNGARNGS